METIYLIRTSPTAKQIESESRIRSEEHKVKSHIFDEDKNNTYCNMYGGTQKSISKRQNHSAFDDRWRLQKKNIPPYEVCNVCLKRYRNKEYDKIKDANDVYKPRYL